MRLLCALKWFVLLCAYSGMDTVLAMIIHDLRKLRSQWCENRLRQVAEFVWYFLYCVVVHRVARVMLVLLEA